VSGPDITMSLLASISSVVVNVGVEIGICVDEGSAIDVGVNVFMGNEMLVEDPGRVSVARSPLCLIDSGRYERSGEAKRKPARNMLAINMPIASPHPKYLRSRERILN